MIKFNCTNCGQKISVPEAYAGKKGKCPKCKSVLTIPQIAPLVDEPEQEYIHAEEENSITDSDLEFHLKREPLSATGQAKKISSDDFGKASDYDYLIKRDIPEEPPVRKLPWYIDIFLYPTSSSGLINLGIFSVLIFLFQVLSVFASVSPYLLIALFIIGITFIGFIFYYFIECIRDSAKGGIRAPDNIGSMPDRGEALSQLWDIVISIVIFWGPILGYNMYINVLQANDPNMEYNPMTDRIFWLLLGYGVFFFPMGILALAMFSSSSAYNPVLWIISIFSTFFQYCGLVIFFCVLALLVFGIASSFRGGILNGVFLNAIFMYLAMVATHLLGRFYYNNSEKLKWEV